MGTLIILDLIANGSATGSWFNWPGGTGTFSVVGTFSGATIKLQFLSGDGSTGIDAGTECTLTAAGAGNFELGPCQIRANVSGSPSGVYARVTGAG